MIALSAPVGYRSLWRPRLQMVPVHHCDIDDIKTGGAFPVKRYESEKENDGAADWRPTEIRLLSENQDFDPIILKAVRADEFHVIAEVPEVLASS